MFCSSGIQLGSRSMVCVEESVSKSVSLLCRRKMYYVLRSKRFDSLRQKGATFRSKLLDAGGEVDNTTNERRLQHNANDENVNRQVSPKSIFWATANVRKSVSDKTSKRFCSRTWHHHMPDFKLGSHHGTLTRQCLQETRSRCIISQY